MNRWGHRQVLECASPLALLELASKRKKAAEDCRSPRRYRASIRFIIPMRAQQRKRAFHEPTFVWSPAFRWLRVARPAEA